MPCSCKPRFTIESHEVPLGWGHGEEAEATRKACLCEAVETLRQFRRQNLGTHGIAEGPVGYCDGDTILTISVREADGFFPAPARHLRRLERLAWPKPRKPQHQPA